MNWEHMFRDYVTPSEFRGLQAHVRKTMRSTHRSRRHLRHRVDDLEANVNFLALLSRTLLQVLIIRGGLNKKDFAKLMKRIDMVDGEELRRTTVAIIATALAVADPLPSDLERYVLSLHKEEVLRVTAAEQEGEAEIAQAWKDWCRGARMWLRAECLPGVEHGDEPGDEDE